VACEQVSGEVEHLVVMGVSGTGKTTLGALLARRLGRPFLEGDEFHPPANVAKMAAGLPLTDDDRWPWLDALTAAMGEHAAAGRSTVVACSALRRAYRDRLRRAPGRVRFVHVAVPAGELHRRMSDRVHFMPPALLTSQLATLEPLADDEDGVTVAAGDDPDALADEALRLLGEAAAAG
jgi:gluconokinase